MELRSKRVVVVGLGKSGVAAARLAARHGARVVGTDGLARDRLGDSAAVLEASGVEVLCGVAAPDLAGADLVVVSPGVPSWPALEAAAAAGVEVIGELELGSRFVHAPIALIGGTNGKSTTTALCHSMIERQGLASFIGGNYGTPLCDAEGTRWDALVLEISSFQAERVPTLHAHAHALLNVTDDHLDRYPSFDAYVHAKGNPFERMAADDVAVVPAGDELCRRQARRGAARIVTFQPAPGIAADVAVVGGFITDASTGLRWPRSLLRLSGTHNEANACASVALATAMGAGRDAIGAALEAFEGLAHRTVLVAEVGGVRWYDDSKGTNVGATVAALRGLVEPKAVLIAGGRDKLGAYEPLVAALRERGRGLVVIGEAAERIAAAAAGAVPIERADGMEAAVAAARRLAVPGDAVLLSPACSSFDMFRDYKDRGDSFVRAVQTLATEGRP